MYKRLYDKGACVDQLKNCADTGDDQICADADTYCGKLEFDSDAFWGLTGRDHTELRELLPDPFPYAFYEDYLNTPKVLEALGAYTNWSAESQTVADAFNSTGDDAREVNTIQYLRNLLADRLTVNMYYGDADYSCNWIGGEAVADALCVEGWEDAGYVNVTTSDGTVHGQVKQAGNFSFTRVYYAGHEAPFYKPVLMLETMQRVMNGKDVATGLVVPDENYRTQGTKKSTFREGNSTMQYQQVYRNTTYDLLTNAPGAYWPGSHPETEEEEEAAEEDKD